MARAKETKAVARAPTRHVRAETWHERTLGSRIDEKFTPHAYEGFVPHAYEGFKPHVHM